MNELKVIAFDADDTLWVNEPYFQETERRFCALLEDYLPQHTVSQELFKTEMKNLPIYGYGIKGFMLCMVETALLITGGKTDPLILQKIIEYGHELLNKEIELLDGIRQVLDTLKGKYRLVVATKGDLLDQERKLAKSGLAPYFHHIEIMSDKQEKDYHKLLKHLDCKPEEFLMIGNSLKSDVMPVLAIGGRAIHIPYHTTWQHEKVEHSIDHEHFLQVETMDQLLKHLAL